MNTIIEHLKTQKFHSRKVIATGIALLLIMLVAEIWSLNRLATFGTQITKFESASAALRMENEMLQNKTAELTSLNTIESHALILGFRPIHSIEYISANDVALVGH